jgi:hypothetical protein
MPTVFLPAFCSLRRGQLSEKGWGKFCPLIRSILWNQGWQWFFNGFGLTVFMICYTHGWRCTVQKGIGVG